MPQTMKNFVHLPKPCRKLLRNPLWHWSHLELSRVFGIKEVLNQSTAQRIWDEANAQLGKISAQTLLAHFRVAAIGTTDDPCDSLSHHIEISKSELKRGFTCLPLTRHSPPMTQNFSNHGFSGSSNPLVFHATTSTHFLKRSPIATLFTTGQPTLRPRD